MEGLSIFKDYFNKIKREMTINSFYMKKAKDGKSMKAYFLDWIFITLALVLFFIITIFNSTKSIFVSVVLTGLLMFFYLFILINWKAKTRVKSINKINEDMAKQQIIKEISQYSNDDFLLYIKDLLDKYYKTTFFEFDYNIDFIGEINEDIYGIKCFKNSLENKVTLRDIENYIIEMKKQNIEEGIIVTNSYFSDEVKEQTNYLLIDFDQIQNILVEIEQFPLKEEIEEIIITKHNNEKRNLKKHLNLHRKDKIYKFILLGIILYVVSFFVSYPLYYRVMAYISILVGMIVGIYNLIEYLIKIRRH